MGQTSVRRFLSVAILLITAALQTIDAAAQTTPAQRIARKIVVLAGEDAVNIIQQKTAVAPLVEVRDDNDLPVAGVLVTFSVRGAKTATFSGGAPTLSVVTDAAGRAAATGFTPIASGTVQINVTAAVQGQTLTTTITQTNFMTAAQAAQSSSGASGSSGAGVAGSGAATAAGAGGAAGGGGGLSGLAIAGIVGGIGAGAFVAARALNANEAPSVSGVAATPAAAVLGADTPIRFSVQATDPDNDSLEYSWDFGDGGSSSEASPSHVYRSAGTFVVRVTASDGDASASGEASVAIKTVNGVWQRTGATAEGTRLTLTQNGDSITGTILFVPPPGSTLPAMECPLSGSVSAASPPVRLTVPRCPLPNGSFVVAATLALTPGTTADSLTGRIDQENGVGFDGTWNRQ